MHVVVCTAAVIRVSLGVVVISIAISRSCSGMLSGSLLHIIPTPALSMWIRDRYVGVYSVSAKLSLMSVVISMAMLATQVVQEDP